MPLNDAIVSIAPEPASMTKKSSSHATSICPRMPRAERMGDQSSSNPSANQSPVNTNAVTADRYEMRRIIRKIVSHDAAVAVLECAF